MAFHVRAGDPEKLELARSLHADADKEARKWTEFLARNLILMNAGAAVAVLSFVGTGKLSNYLWAAITLLSFVVGALLVQLTALGNLHGAQHQVAESQNYLAEYALASSWRGKPKGRIAMCLSDNALPILYSAMACFVLGAAIGLVSLWHERARGAVGLPYLGGS